LAPEVGVDADQGVSPCTSQDGLTRGILKAVIASPSITSPAELYLVLLKQVLTRSLFDEEVATVRASGSRLRRLLVNPVQWLAGRQGMELVRRLKIDPAARETGLGWPVEAETMVGLRRLENIQSLIRTVIDEEVPGDWLEAGVWRGGASIFARAALEAYGDTERLVWVADSFAGLPKPSLEEDEGVTLWKHDYLAVPLEEVQRNFARYGLLDERVRFLPGWFKDTLPSAPIERLAILRLDGDMYESTVDALRLYDKLSPGGYLIVDDYGLPDCPGAKLAVDEFRAAHAITAPLVEIDWGSVFWRKDDH
jgi:O-methyltransferase